MLTAGWQNLNAKVTGGGGVITKVAESAQGKGSRRVGTLPGCASSVLRLRS